MDSEQRFWLTLWAIIGASVLLTALVVCTGVCLNNKIAFNAGYERQQKQGTTESMWVRSTR